MFRVPLLKDHVTPSPQSPSAHALVVVRQSSAKIDSIFLMIELVKIVQYQVYSKTHSLQFDVILLAELFDIKLNILVCLC